MNILALPTSVILRWSLNVISSAVLKEAAPVLVTQETPDQVTEEMPLASQQHKAKINQETLDLITVMTFVSSSTR
jgi:hypothetical protein